MVTVKTIGASASAALLRREHGRTNRRDRWRRAGAMGAGASIAWCAGARNALVAWRKGAGDNVIRRENSTSLHFTATVAPHRGAVCVAVLRLLFSACFAQRRISYMNRVDMDGRRRQSIDGSVWLGSSARAIGAGRVGGALHSSILMKRPENGTAASVSSWRGDRDGRWQGMALHKGRKDMSWACSGCLICSHASAGLRASCRTCDAFSACVMRVHPSAKTCFLRTAAEGRARASQRDAPPRM